MVARIFSLEATRRGYLGAKTWLDRAFGGLLGLLGVKVALS
jgi:threonine/homoserine/homoserine lactone efflux protein